MSIFKQGAFQTFANLTPAQIETKRQLMAAMMPKYGDAEYVGEGVGQLFSGIARGAAHRKLDKAESEGRKSAEEQFARLFGTANSAQSQDMGPLSVLGMTGGPALPPPDPNSPHALGNDAMAALGKPAVKTAADPESIKAGLVARGLPEHIADGFVMNMRDESGLNPGINEVSPLVPGSRGGFGLYQLTGPRRRAFEAYASERGLPLDDVDAQLDFLMAELQGPEKAAWDKISGTQNAGEAGAAIVNSFLRPAEEHRSAREARYLGGTTSAAAAPTSAPAIPINELYMALQNPWLSTEQKGLITSMIQEQQQASDPLRQLELRKAEVELAQLENPDKTPEEFSTRMFTLNSLGIDPRSDEGKVYLMTGKLPEPTKQGYTRMSPEQVAAIPGLDPGKAYQVSPEGKIEAIGGGGVSVTNNMGGDKFDDEFAKLDAQSLGTISEAGIAATRNLGRIDQLDELLQASPSGFGASMAQAAGEWGINTSGLSELQAAQALINSLVPEQRQPGSGPMSDADLALFKQSLPRLINQPGGNQAILQTMRAIAQYDAEGAQIVQAVRSGEITRAEAFARLQNRKNPLEAFKAGDDAAPTGPKKTTINGYTIEAIE